MPFVICDEDGCVAKEKKKKIKNIMANASWY